MSEFQDLVAVVTGAASGIGLATAEALASSGARVAGFDATVPAAPPKDRLMLQADVTDQESIDAAVGQAFNASANSTS